jgi:valyl-tRNA synthetase
MPAGFPGSDHASIATEARVVAMLKEKGIEKKQLTREAFLEYAYEWRKIWKYYLRTERNWVVVDWNRTRLRWIIITAVISVFVELFRKNDLPRCPHDSLDPAARTALSLRGSGSTADEGLYYVRYPVADSTEFIPSPHKDRNHHG